MVTIYWAKHGKGFVGHRLLIKTVKTFHEELEIYLAKCFTYNLYRNQIIMLRKPRVLKVLCSTKIKLTSLLLFYI